MCPPLAHVSGGTDTLQETGDTRGTQTQGKRRRESESQSVRNANINQ